ncbi:hypothetical protein BKA62DRAFT_674285 [Auriculariales sp. MPI-PUGE-AT-0066]|nr:hypothetical protein BKA62DRAFT_674285 [Auriculariales sp. MPI-PUGE-AT-0066]
MPKVRSSQQLCCPLCPNEFAGIPGVRRHLNAKHYRPKYVNLVFNFGIAGRLTFSLARVYRCPWCTFESTNRRKVVLHMSNGRDRREDKAGRQPYEGCKSLVRDGLGTAKPSGPFQGPRIDLVDEWMQAGDPLPPAAPPSASIAPNSTLLTVFRAVPASNTATGFLAASGANVGYDNQDADGETDSGYKGDLGQMQSPEASFRSSQPTDRPNAATVQARAFNRALVQPSFRVELTNNFSDPPAQSPPVIATQHLAPEASRILKNASVRARPTPQGKICGFSPNPVLVHQTAIQYLPPPSGQIFMQMSSQGDFGVDIKPAATFQRPVTRYLPPPAPVPQQSSSASTSSVFMQQQISQYPPTWQRVYPHAIPLAQNWRTWYESVMADDLTPEVWADVLM